MHILVITDGFPFPLTSGRLRQFHFLKQLGRSHRITLVSAVPPDHPAEHAAALAHDLERIETVHSRRLRRGVRAKTWSRIRPEGTAGIEARIAALHARDRFDVVLNARLPLPLRELLPGVPIVTDICDAVSDSLFAQMRFAPPWQAPLLLAKHLDARRDEDRMAAESDHLLFASGRDRALLAARRESMPPTTILPNGVDVGFWQRRTPALGRDTVVFAGAMPYGPNEDAAIYLIQAIMPIVRRSRPDARLLIVGRDPRRRLIVAARGQPNVELTGFVTDMRDHLERASVVVAALRYATGIQNKILEAMAMAVPVVTTPVAEAGLLSRGDDRPPIAVASDPVRIAAFTVRRLDAADDGAGPDLAARGWVGERFRWDAIGSQLDEILQTTRPA